jgi:hypothetical protein
MVTAISTSFQRPLPITPLLGTKTMARPTPAGPQPTSPLVRGAPIPLMLLIWMATVISISSRPQTLTIRLPGTKTMGLRIRAGAPPISPPVRRARVVSVSPTWTAMATSILSQLRVMMTRLPGTKTMVRPTPAGLRPISPPARMVL